MTESRKIGMTALPVPTIQEPRQMSIMFESNKLHGLTAAGRTKVLLHLAELLMLAGAAALEEHDDEC